MKPLTTDDHEGDSGVNRFSFHDEVIYSIVENVSISYHKFQFEFNPYTGHVWQCGCKKGKFIRFP